MQLASAISRPLSARALAAWTALLLLPCGALADQNMGRTPAHPEDHGIFQRASRSMNNFFNRLFGTEGQKKAGPAPRTPPPPPPPASRGTRSRGPRYNLDQPPTEANTPTGTRAGTAEPTPGPQGTGASKPPARSTEPRFAVPEDEPPKSKPKPKPAATSLGATAATSLGATASTSAGSAPPAPKPPAPPEPRTGAATTASADTPPPSKPPEPARTEPTPTPPPPKPAADTQNVLSGTKTNKAGRVKSPYPPYSELDVTGLPSGSLALDPTTQKIFRVP